MYKSGLDHYLDLFDRSWQKDAACKSAPQEWFFPPEKGPAPKQAKELCQSCKVRLDCAIFAIERSIKDGIWGGFNVRQRRAIGLSTFKAWKEDLDVQRAVQVE